MWQQHVGGSTMTNCTSPNDEDRVEPFVLYDSMLPFEHVAHVYGVTTYRFNISLSLSRETIIILVLFVPVCVTNLCV